MCIFRELTKKHKLDKTCGVCKNCCRKIKHPINTTRQIWGEASRIFAHDQIECWGFTPHAWSLPHKPVNSSCHSTHLEALTKVDVVISSSLAVHLVDKEAGHRFEQQAEDGHPRAEAKHVPPWFCGEVIYRVIDPKMDDVGQYRHDHPHQKLRGKTTTVTLLNFNWMCQRGKVLFTLVKVPKHLIIMPRGNFYFAAKNACGKQTHSLSEKRALWGEMR